MPLNQTYQVKVLNPNVGIGIYIPFTSPSAFKTTYDYKEQIKYNLINLLLTNKGERIFNPDFGTNLRKQLFNQIVEGNNDLIIDDITNTIIKYIPEIFINSIDIKNNPDTNTFTFYLNYSIKLTNESDNINIVFE